MATGGISASLGRRADFPAVVVEESSLQSFSSSSSLHLLFFLSSSSLSLLIGSPLKRNEEPIYRFPGVACLVNGHEIMGKLGVVGWTTDIESLDRAPFIRYLKVLMISEMGSLDLSRRAARFDYKLVKFENRLVTQIVVIPDLIFEASELILPRDFCPIKIIGTARQAHWPAQWLACAAAHLRLAWAHAHLAWARPHCIWGQPAGPPDPCCLAVGLRFETTTGVKMGDHTSTRNPPAKEDRRVAQPDGSKKVHKAPKTNDVISTITEDSFISFRKNFHFPNDLVMKVPTRSDRACFPPPGYMTVYEFSLRAEMQFPPSPELIDIMMVCGVSLSQFFYRAMSIVMVMIVLFIDRGVVLSPECLSQMGRLLSDTYGRISFRSKWLDIRTRDPSKGWISDFFYVQNDLNLQEKWGKLRELLVPLHIGAEYLLKILKLCDLEALHYEVHYLSRYIDEKYLFKVGLSTQAGRSHAQMLKRSVKVPEIVPQKNHSKRPGSEGDLQAPKKKANEILTVAGKGPCISPSKSYIPEDVLKHKCIGRRQAEEMMNKILDDWNNEFVKEAHNHIYDVEVKALKAECLEDGFIKGFMMGVHVVHRKTGAEIEGLTPSQASSDPSSNYSGEELESELQQAFSLEEDEDDIEIL
ncbi:hypothetical protein MA16_Dca014852 [Dendrobium catenatum]|uniref:Uncharacterized protein n=1 Tax=Dendrobium catenatum TaxID=906689 RepID=A0A2I0V6S1_9ASPA|nr:hypothetical protein MA16_Dca014852 [Dendrobium catenatum]